MKNIRNILITLIVLTIVAPSVKAGNEQRAGEAGASELLINPWAVSSGFANANMACVKGFEAMFLNVAGTAFTNNVELGFVHTDLYSGAGIGVNSFGLSKRVGESSTLSGSVVMVNFGDLDQTLVEKPDGNGNTFAPTYSVITVAYAREFSNSIYGGFALKAIHEGTSNVGASGIAIDAGIQYVTGDREQLHFGMSMQNVGPTMSFKGDGLTLKGTTSEGIIQTLSYQNRVFELPSLIRIGASYDFFLAEGHNLLVAANFTSNSFTKDNYNLGLEYSFKSIFKVRGGFVYEDGIFDDSRTTVYTGPTAGASVQIPLGKDAKSYFAIDYSYRATDPFDGVHSVGARLIF